MVKKKLKVGINSDYQSFLQYKPKKINNNHKYLYNTEK